ncbi:CoA transferase [Candidimonas nitroreducens]|uniref:CoA transferase n=2 Tax=Candidimonas nitroreducens TaxID=683354 RepID=A0A225MYU3_9BURK|nr:CoA transferase [Candidimonas nitroreducens]
MPGCGPLAGLRILDMATVLAAPSAAALLADYGAEVVKIELPGAGDTYRNLPPFKDGKSLWWKVTNRNKKMMSLDVRKPEGLELFKRMLPNFDVVIENFRPGTLDKWGLDLGTLWKIQPGLVILRATAFGQTGPYRSRPGYARTFEAMGGLTYITGEADGTPMHTGYPIGDAIGGLFGALGVLAALLKRARDPGAPGEEIDLSLTEGVLKLLEFLPIKYAMLGQSHERSGNSSQTTAPAGVFLTRDAKWISLAGSTDALFASNCHAIGREELIKHPKFCNNRVRCDHAEELNLVFKKWFSEHDLEYALASFERHGGTLAPIYSAEQIFKDPHIQAREFIRTVADQDFGEVPIQGVVPRFARNPGSVRVPGGSVGQDNDEILGDWLSLSEKEREDLRNKGVI